MIGSHPAKGYASHGETWSLALAMRLAGWDLLSADAGTPAEQPILVLDDVFAELDTGRRDRWPRGSPRPNRSSSPRPSMRTCRTASAVSASARRPSSAREPSDDGRPGMSGIERDPSTPVAALEALDRVRRMEVTEARFIRGRRRSRVRTDVTYTSAGKDRRDPTSISSVLGGFIATQGWSSSIDIGKVLGRWSDLVGEQVARHATPVDFSPPALVIAADSTTWATRLRVLRPTILRALEAGLGSATITELEIRGPQGRASRRAGAACAGEVRGTPSGELGRRRRPPNPEIHRKPPAAIAGSHRVRGYVSRSEKAGEDVSGPLAGISVRRAVEWTADSVHLHEESHDDRGTVPLRCRGYHGT